MLTIFQDNSPSGWKRIFCCGETVRETEARGVDGREAGEMTVRLSGGRRGFLRDEGWVRLPMHTLRPGDLVMRGIAAAPDETARRILSVTAHSPFSLRFTAK